MVSPDGVSAYEKYGPAGLIAAMVNILFIELVVWLLLPWFYLAVFLVPLLIIDAGASALLARRTGVVGQVGRGLLIGCMAGPAAVVFFVPLYMAVDAAGLI